MAKKTYTAADGLTVSDLLHFGFDYISAAETLLRGNARHFDAAGYLAHIGFELLLKAWHLHANGSFKETHSLRGLWDGIRKSANLAELPREHAKTLGILDDYVDLRYPNLSKPVEIGSDDLPEIRALLKAILNLMPPAMHQIADQLNPTQKAGRILMKRPVEPKRRPRKK